VEYPCKKREKNWIVNADLCAKQRIEWKNIACEKIQSEYKLKLINSEANSKIGEGGE
jgi:hypothetical protein